MENETTNELHTSRLGPWMRVFATAWILIVSLALTGHSGQNPNHSVVASGGSVAAESATRRVSGALGQVASNRAQSPTNTLSNGFWNTVASCDCPFVGDLDTNGVISISDVVLLVNIAFRGAPMAPGDPNCPLTTRADVNCNGVVSVSDVVTIVNTAFRGSDDRCDPCSQ